MMHELVSSVLGSASDEVTAPLQLKPLSLPTLELVYAQMIRSKCQKGSSTDKDQSNVTPTPGGGDDQTSNNIVQMVAKC